VRATGVENKDSGNPRGVEGGEHDGVCNRHVVVTLIRALDRAIRCLFVD